MSSNHPDSAHNGSPNGEPLSLEENAAPRKRGFVIAWCIFSVIAFVGFIMLGNWQLDRRVWKLALIERAETRARAPAIPAPPPAEWPKVSRESHEYLHVTTAGRFAHEAVTFVQASTNLGAGFWALVPLQQDDGNLVIINRGFVEKREHYKPVPGATQQVHMSGLLRINEPGGSRMRKNEPENERWFSRDVEAIGTLRQLPADKLAPYFIDADYNPAASKDEPVGGLTVLNFYNHHLVYALTLYTLALMVAGSAVYLVREESKKKRA